MHRTDLFQGLLEITAGPTWRHQDRELAAVVEIRGDWNNELVARLDDGRTWTIRRVVEGAQHARRRRLRSLAADRYELGTDAADPAVWSEQLGTAAARRALTDHVGVGLAWVDRWRLANATARGLQLMLDLVTADQRFELRPRFDAVAYPVYPAPLADPAGRRVTESASPTDTTPLTRLLNRGAAVGEAGHERFLAFRPIPLGVALLASYVMYDKRPKPS